MTKTTEDFSLFLWRQRQTLAANVKRLRRERGLTQTQLAELTRLHANTVTRLENPEMDSVTLLTMARIAWALHLPINELLTEDEHGTPL